MQIYQFNSLIDIHWTDWNTISFSDRKRQAEQREAARREMERQRQLEWEKQRLQELQQQRQREQETVLKLKAKNQSLTIELSSLNDQVKELSQKICDTRIGEIIESHF